MTAARCQILGCRPVEEDTVFDFEIAEYEIAGGYCQIQMRATRREGCASFKMDWGDGTVVEQSEYVVWHNYTKAGRYTVRLGKNVKWWRLWECCTVTSDNRILISRPAIYPKCWSDWLESCQGTYCGWNNSDHGGVQGRVIPWGRSIASTFCCYQFCFDITGGFPPWTPAITNATGTFDRCTGLSGLIPRWGRNITEVAQCYCDCPGARGKFLPWPERCTDFASCFKNATGMHGEIPAWPECAETLDSAFEGCTGATGIIPKWPEAVKSVNSCYKGCTGLTGAWTDDPALLMPEEKLRYSPDSNYYRGAGVPVNMQMQDTVFAGDRAVISIDSPALAHKLDPSPPPIRPGAGKKYLTIPATAEAAGRSARDFPALVFERVLPGGGSAPARGGGSGARPALVEKSSGKVYYWLARLVRTPHDPDALPSDERLARAASDAARQAVSVLSP